MNYKVCFICTGNACRSPFAEYVTKHLLEKENIGNVEVCSCGTLSWGANPRDTNMTAVAAEMGYTMAGKTTPMTRELLSEVDLIVVFETHHRNLVTRTLDYNQWGKIALFDALAFGTPTEVEDPNNQPAATYRRIASHIESGCQNIVRQWVKNPPTAS